MRHFKLLAYRVHQPVHQLTQTTLLLIYSISRSLPTSSSAAAEGPRDLSYIV